LGKQTQHLNPFGKGTTLLIPLATISLFPPLQRGIERLGSLETFLELAYINFTRISPPDQQKTGIAIFPVEVEQDKI